MIFKEKSTLWKCLILSFLCHSNVQSQTMGVMEGSIESFHGPTLKETLHTLPDYMQDQGWNLPLDIDEMIRQNKKQHDEQVRQEIQALSRQSGTQEQWVYDGKVMRPLFEGSGLLTFQPALQPDKGRTQQILKAMADHEREKPVGWDALVQRVRQEGQDKGEMAMLALADGAINTIPYVDGTDGTFFSPARLWKRGGVCKDFAVAKYILLKEAGYSIERLRLAVVTPQNQNYLQWHVVLMAKTESHKEPLVLDIINPFTYMASLKGSIAQKVKTIREQGIQWEDIKPQWTALTIIPIARYSAQNRALDWVGNEKGGAYFSKSLPRPTSTTLEVASNDKTPMKAYFSGRQWVAMKGQAPFARITLKSMKGQGEGSRFASN